jgi:hypothetical protein
MPLVASVSTTQSRAVAVVVLDTGVVVWKVTKLINWEHPNREPLAFAFGYKEQLKELGFWQI